MDRTTGGNCNLVTGVDLTDLLRNSTITARERIEQGKRGLDVRSIRLFAPAAIGTLLLEESSAALVVPVATVELTDAAEITDLLEAVQRVVVRAVVFDVLGHARRDPRQGSVQSSIEARHNPRTAPSESLQAVPNDE